MKIPLDVTPITQGGPQEKYADNDQLLPGQLKNWLSINFDMTHDIILYNCFFVCFFCISDFG